MNSEEFVEALKVAVQESGQRAMEQMLEKPPGRRPRPQWVGLSNWFQTLDPEAKKNVSEIISNSIHMAVFRFLCVIDGAAFFEDSPEKGDFKLYYVKGEQVLLNPREGEMLHDLWNAD